MLDNYLILDKYLCSRDYVIPLFGVLSCSPYCLQREIVSAKVVCRDFIIFFCITFFAFVELDSYFYIYFDVGNVKENADVAVEEGSHEFIHLARTQRNKKDVLPPLWSGCRLPV